MGPIYFMIALLVAGLFVWPVLVYFFPDDLDDEGNDE